MPGADQEKYQQVLGANAMKSAGLQDYSWITRLPQTALEELLKLVKKANPAENKTRRTKGLNIDIADPENMDNNTNYFAPKQ